uniref:Uncharacterized protein n=1 Tax=Candidatus Kentrum sp. TUN TaxID=2126343 RepID=A0A451AK01_9GAMM|nr:MAG: hypothetical protein BECKTUN1418D_GA0071000_14821 [Candidatus Kentron sp. TUN]
MRKYNAGNSKKIPNPVDTSNISNTVLAVEIKSNTELMSA